MTRDANAKTKREFHADAIKRLQTEMQNGLQQWDLFMVEEKMIKLQSDFEKFDAKNMAITCDDAAESGTKQECEAMQKEIEAIFFATKALLRKKMATANSASGNDKEASDTHTVVKESHSQVEKQADKVEKAKPLYRFSGSLNDWSNFKQEIQKSVIGNDDLDDEKRMIELIQCLPIELLNECKTSGFKDTWEKMLEKYDTKYRLANFVTCKMTSWPKLVTPSPSSIGEMIERAKTVKQAFEEIGGIEAQHIVMFTLCTKLDEETMRAWQRHRKVLAESWALANGKNKRDHLPSLEALLKFLDDEKEVYSDQAIDMQAQFEHSSDALTNAQTQQKFPCNFGASTSSKQANTPVMQTDNTQSQANPMQANANASTQHSSSFASGVCFLCNKNMHALFRCPVFLAKSIVDRVKVVSDRNLCIKCLKACHGGQCLDPKCENPCHRCSTQNNKVRHNSALCERNEYTVRPMQKQIVVTNDEEDWDD